MKKVYTEKFSCVGQKLLVFYPNLDQDVPGQVFGRDAKFCKKFIKNFIDSKNLNQVLGSDIFGSVPEARTGNGGKRESSDCEDDSTGRNKSPLGCVPSIRNRRNTVGTTTPMERGSKDKRTLGEIGRAHV